MKIRFNYSEINPIAAAFYRKGIEENPAIRCRAFWALCMKEAYAEYRERAERAAAAAEEMRPAGEVFPQIDGEEFYNRAIRAAAAMPGRMLSIPRKNKETGEITYIADSSVMWMIPESRGGLALMAWEDALQTIAGEMFVVMSEKLGEWHDKPFKYAMYDSAMTAVRRIDKAMRDRPRRAKRPGMDAAYMEDPDGVPGYHAPAPEKIAIARAAIEALAGDDDDRRIINGMMDGKTQKEIAAAIGHTQSFVAKRIAKMKERANA